MPKPQNIILKFRRHLILVVSVTLLLTVFSVFFFTTQIAKRLSAQYTEVYAQRLASDIQSVLSRGMVLAEKLTSTTELSEWIDSPDDASLNRKAAEELFRFSGLFTESTPFVVLGNDYLLYTASLDNPDYHLDAVNHLEETNEEDQWFFDFIHGNSNTSVILIHDPDSDMHQLILLTKCYDHSGQLNVIGTKIPSEFLLASYQQEDESSILRAFLIDSSDESRLESEYEVLLEKNTLIFDHNLFQFFEGDIHHETLTRYFKNPKPNYTIPLHQYTLTLVPISDTTLHIAVLYGIKFPFLFNETMPFLISVLLALIILSVLINRSIRNTFFKPFVKLTESIRQKEMFQSTKIYGQDSDDEFGILARSIEQMSDRLVRSVPVGLFLLDTNGFFTYCNEYLVKEFSSQTMEALIKRLNTETESLFSDPTDYQKLLNAFFKQYDLYFEVQMLDFNGQPFWAEIHLSLISEGGIPQYYEGILINIQRKKDHEQQLMDKASTDMLTHLYNRQYFETLVAEEIERNNRYGGALSLIIFDLDHFKKVNDTWGHIVGDKVLQNTALLAKSILRKTDTIARWGGEEFAILLPNITLRGAIIVAEKIRKRLETYVHEDAGVVSASFGVAQRFSEESYANWFKRADNALFKAKNLGRNRVITLDPGEQLTSTFIKLTWQDAFNSGNPMIDGQHRMLFSLANALYEESLLPSNHQKLVNQFESLMAHIATHFQEEEKILNASHYPEESLSRHQEIHRRLLERAALYHEQIISGNMAVSSIVNALIREVIINHMIRDDVDFFDYVNPNRMTTDENKMANSAQ